MSLRLRLALLVALLAAATDALLTRAAFAHREPELGLFPQAWLLWLVYALLALAPASLLAIPFTRRRPPAERPLRLGLVLAAVTIAPVLAHGVLDRHTSLGGDLSGLRTPGPWLAVGGRLVAVCAAVWVLARLFARVPARALGWGLGALGLVLGAWATLAPAESAPATAGAAEPAGDRPNLLFLVWDTTRAQSLNLYGYERATTPHLARLADESLVFDGARSAAVFTLSSHVSMLTGTYPSHHRASLTRQWFNPRETPPVAALLRDAGYRTGAFVGTDVLRADTGVIEGFERFDDATDPPVAYTRGWALLHDVQSIAAKAAPALYFDGNPHWIQDFQRPAGPVLERALEWIGNGDPRPWFCFVNLYDVHWPYVPAEDFRAEWVTPYDGPVDGYLFRSGSWQQGYRLDASDKRHLEELYDGEMAALDDDVERFLAALEGSQGEFAMLLTSDHGEAFGEAERYEHFDVLEPQVRVPFLVRGVGPSAPRGWVREPVSGVDVAPTLLALAGVAPDAAWIERCAGTSLLGAAARSPRRDRPILVENRDKMDVAEFRIALYQGPWKLVRTGVGERASWELFRHETDPWEEEDQAALEPQVVAQMQQALDEWRGSWEATDEVGPGAGNLDAMGGLGYLDGGEPPDEGEDH